MDQLRRDETLEQPDELMNALGTNIEFEEFDRDNAIALDVVAAKHRPQRACTDLMKYSKRTERIWRRRARSFRVQ
jgi:hypothetical protein